MLYGRKGHNDYLAHLLVDEGRVTHGEFPPIVREFVDVFLEDLASFLPIREIKFTTDLVLGMSPISIPLYQMAPIELKESKSQLEELKDKGFILPTALP